MPKKKRGSHRTRKAKAQQPRRRPLHAVAGPADLAGLDPRLAPLAAPFIQWHTAGEDPRDMHLEFGPLHVAREGFRAVGDVVAALEDEVGPCAITDFRPEDLRTLFEVVLPRRDLEAGELSNMAACMILFLTFLDETGRWTGLPSDLEACRDVALETMREAYPQSAVGRLLGGALVPQVSAEGEIAFLQDLPLVGRLRSLLDWWGPARPVTDTGAMKLADVVAAAQLFGVHVRTPARPVQDDEPDAALVTAGGSMVRSMWEVPELASLWTTARGAGLLDVQPPMARRTAEVALLADGPDGERLPVLRRVVTGYVASRVLGCQDTMGSLGTLVSSLVLEVLAASLTHHAMSPADLEDAVYEELTVPFAGAPEMVTRLVGGILEHFAKLGLLTIGELYEVPEPLQSSVAMAVDLVVKSDEDEDLDDDPY